MLRSFMGAHSLEGSRFNPHAAARDRRRFEVGGAALHDAVGDFVDHLLEQQRRCDRGDNPPGDVPHAIACVLSW
jgi:hypothetical protein